MAAGCVPPEVATTAPAGGAYVAPSSPSDPPAPSPRGRESVRFLPRVDQAARPTEPTTGTEAATPGGGGGPAGRGRPESAAPPTPTPRACAGIVRRVDDDLELEGVKVTFFGVNAAYLLDPEVPEAVMASSVAQMAQRGVNAVRVWFFHQHDPDRLDRLLALGATHGIRFIVVLGDNVFKGEDWFFGSEDEKRFRPHLQATVARFAGRPEVLLWEPINEANCGDGRFDDECLKTIRDWMAMATEMIRAIDPCHPVSTGMIGSGNMDTEIENYRRINRKGAVQVVSVHADTGHDITPELELGEDADKPVVFGEVYDVAYDEGCQPLNPDAVRDRARRVKDHLRTALDDGVDGYLLWEWSPGLVHMADGSGDRHFCSRFSFTAEDPLWPSLRNDALPPPVPW